MRKLSIFGAALAATLLSFASNCISSLRIFSMRRARSRSSSSYGA